ncbi:MAG: zf-HC2 domain-containing protein [Candidatus Omnitrophota bacterium]
MDCRKIRRLLNRYIDKEIAGREVTLVEAHLKECVDCRRELAAIEAVQALMTQKGKIAVQGDFLSGLRDKLQAQPQKIRVRWLPEAGDWSRRLIPLPLAVLSLLFVLLLAGLNGRNSASSVDEYIYADLTNEELAVLTGYIDNSDLLQVVMNIN